MNILCALNILLVPIFGVKLFFCKSYFFVFKTKIKLVLFISLLSFNYLYPQVELTDYPLDNQLIGRDDITNSGTFKIAGEVYDSEFSSISIIVNREDELYDYQTQDLNFDNSLGLFNFEITIIAELMNYSVNVYSHFGNDSTLELNTTNIVCGDVFVIQGQSNAQAKMESGSSHDFLDNFIRVYSSSTDSTELLIENHQWYYGQGDGGIETNGNTGQWGLRFAKHFVDSMLIPIAIFNQSKNGTGISKFLAPTTYQSNLESIYSKLYYRLSKNNLQDFVKAIFWSQGEYDSNVNSPITIENGIAIDTEAYKNAFFQLQESWENDFMNLKHIYIFQTKNGCNKPIEKLMEIKEAQRQLALESESISIIPTASLQHHTDYCHFTFSNGYEEFGNRLFSLVKRDIYGYSSNFEIDAPFDYQLYRTASNTVVISTNSDELICNDFANDFEYDGINIDSTKISVYKNYIIIKDLEFLNDSSSLSYKGNYLNDGYYIQNSNQIEMVCFKDIIIQGNTGWKCDSKACVISTENIEFNSINECLESCGVSNQSEHSFTKKKLRKIVNVLGQECLPEPNEALFYIYEDGSVQKKFIVE